jgi:hypothetical protein
MRIRGDIRQQKSVLCSVLCRIARSQFCWFGNAKPKIFFYCHGVGMITYDQFFWKTVTLTASVKAEQNLLSWNSPLCGIAQSQFLALNLIEHLREFEFICKTVFAHESGDPKVQFNEKNWGSKILWDCPFNRRVLPSHQALNRCYKGPWHKIFELRFFFIKHFSLGPW